MKEFSDVGLFLKSAFSGFIDFVMVIFRFSICDDIERKACSCIVLHSITQQRDRLLKSI